MQNNFHIIQITSDYPPRPLWGMGIYVETLQNGFSEKCVDITSCVATASKNAGRKGVCITTTSADDARLLSKEDFAIFDDYPKFLRWQEKLADTIIDYIQTQATKPLVLHAHNWMSWIAAKKVSRVCNIPIVVSVHFLQKQYETMIENPIPTYHDDIVEMEREMLSGAHGLICFSEKTKSLIRDAYKVRRDGIVIIPHTATVHLDDTVTFEATRDILFLGRLTHDKGVIRTIEVIQALRRIFPDTRLHIIGTGKLAGAIRKQALSFIIMYGYISNTQKIARIAQKCSFSILPTTSDVFPISIVDSMACGCVPVLLDRDDVAVMFENGVSGLRIPEPFVANTVDSIAQLFGDKEKLITFRKQTRAYYRDHYALEKMLNNTRMVYESVLLKYGRVKHI